MSWVKLDDQFPDHPKIMQAGPAAAWLHVCGLCYCGRLLSDGYIPTSQVRKLADVDDCMALVRVLIECGLWEEVRGGFQIHDYLEYNPSKESVIAERDGLSRIRSEAGKKGMASRWNNKNNKTITNGLQTPLQNDNPVPVPVPVPVSPTPSPSPNPDPTATPNVNGLTTDPREKAAEIVVVQSAAQMVWTAYSEAYSKRYGTAPVRNAKVNSQITQFVKRVPADNAPQVAAFYVWHNQQFYVSKGHPIGLLLADAEKLHTEWVTGKRATVKAAREQDRIQERGDMWQKLIEEAEREERAIQGHCSNG